MTAATRMSRVRQAVLFDRWARSIVVIVARSFQVRERRLSRENGVRRAWACFLRRYEPDQVPRVCGLATLSALLRSPEAVFNWRHRTPARGGDGFRARRSEERRVG